MITRPAAFPLVSQRLFNRPHLIHPEKAQMLMAALAGRLGIARLDITDRNGVRTLAADDMVAMIDDLDAEPARYRGYDVHDGVAVIPVEGTLVNKLGTLRPYSGMTGYDGLRVCFLNALADAEVKAVVFDMNSPGGEVSGCFDLVDLIAAAAGTKPVWAILDDMACSACYALASACDRIVLPRTGYAGSIGVCCMHVDYSTYLQNEGVAVTLIHAGAHKVDGNPYETLPASVRKDMQAEIDKVYRIFVDTVAANRAMDAEKVRATEARVFMGQDAVSAGLADAVQAPDEAFADLVASL